MNTDSNYDPDIIHNLQKADKSHKTGEEFIRMTQGRGLDRPRENQGGWILKYIGAILTVVIFILILINFYSYMAHWIVDIVSGKCTWWSLGFICTRG